MSFYGEVVEDLCRFCGINLPTDPVTIMAHINTHWRQVNMESLQLNPCAFEPHVDIRVSNTPLNPEDQEEGSGNMDQNFHYTYSPQAEPSNLSVVPPRSSPLNLTGRSKPVTPLSSPISQPTFPSAAHPPISYQMPLHHEPLLPSGHLYIPSLTHAHCNYSLGLLNNTHLAQGIISNPQLQSHEGDSQTLEMQQNIMPNSHDIDMGIQIDQQVLSESCKRRQFERFEMRCTICGRIFFTKGTYDEHLHYHLKENNSFIQTESVEQPKILPLNGLSDCALTEKPYKCSICDREFSFKEDLLEHTEYHEAAKPYKCDICGLGLSKISALRRHRLTHTGFKPHVCDICSKGFKQKCDLQRHYVTHKSKQHECSDCKKKYPSLKLLENHKCKQIKDEKPFKCNICGEGCSNDMVWSYHMWRHTKNPKFVPYQKKFSIQKG